MGKIKKTLRSIINKTGFDIHSLPPVSDEKPILPIKTEDDLGLYKTSLGDFYLPLDAPNDVIINHMKQGQIFEPEVVKAAKQFIKKGTAVLDVGANLGQMSLIFSNLVGDDGIVYSFEAQRRVFEILKKNIVVNSIHNLRPLFNAVYFESHKTFYFPEPDFVKFQAYGSYNLPLDATAGQEVESLKIDDLQIEKPISFMKVDVQGCDLFAMQGAIETIRKHKMPILFEFEQQFQHTYKTSFQDYVDFVDSIEYKFVEIILDINYLIEPK
jgi:FkbM family methyltransferase